MLLAVQFNDQILAPAKLRLFRTNHHHIDSHNIGRKRELQFVLDGIRKVC